MKTLINFFYHFIPVKAVHLPPKEKTVDLDNVSALGF